MNAQIELIEGTNRNTELSQYFTPPKLAAKLVEWAFAGRTSTGEPLACQARVLEPSAGNGAIVRPLVAAGAEVYAVEIDDRYFDALARISVADRDDRLEFGIGDFFSMQQALDQGYPLQFDLCVMNPPYHDDGESKFITHALKFAPRVVGIFRADVFYTVTRAEGLWSKVRPTRVAFCARRPWKGAETDYCALELVQRNSPATRGVEVVHLEWWQDSWT